MEVFLVLSLILIPFALVFVALYFRKDRLSGESAAKVVKTSAVGSILAILLVSAGLVLTAGTKLHAQQAATPTAEVAKAPVSNGSGMGMIAMGIAVGLASIGAGIAVGMASAAAIGAISEDPSMFTKSLIFVAMGEGIAIYGILIAVLIYVKI